MLTKKTPIRNLLFLIQKRCFLSSSAAANLSPPLSAANSSSSASFTVQYLVKSCGLSLKSAISVSQKFQIPQNKFQNAQSVLQLLKAHQFDDTHIAQLLEKRPQILHSGVEDYLKPKFDFFINNGFTGQLLTQLIVSNPYILKSSLDSQIKPCFELLKSILGSHENIIAANKRSPRLFSYDLKGALQPNIELLIKEGVPVDRVAKLVLMHPTAILRKHASMVSAVNDLKNMAFQPGHFVFIEALRVMLQMSQSTRNKKVEVFKSLGWTEEEILLTFKRCPLVLSCSEKKIKSAMDFYVNTMRLRPQAVIAHPLFLRFSIDKRIRPRYTVLKTLESKKLIQEETKIPKFLSISEKKFMEIYVTKYAEHIPDLLEIHRGTSKALKMDT